mmetsp:Transcript_5879/g.6389  ORF Transcript_5879/g.6389 Transcript_5879/m.6389 type:complete len:142 (-) Transcript_5879:430-855(-)
MKLIIAMLAILGQCHMTLLCCQLGMDIILQISMALLLHLQGIVTDLQMAVITEIMAGLVVIIIEMVIEIDQGREDDTINEGRKEKNTRFFFDVFFFEKFVLNGHFSSPLFFAKVHCVEYNIGYYCIFVYNNMNVKNNEAEI